MCGLIDARLDVNAPFSSTSSNFASSMNYTLNEYANDVVYHIQQVCDEEKVAHPTIISESGRAIVAHHSLLVFNVLGVSGFGNGDFPTVPTPEMEQPLVDLDAVEVQVLRPHQVHFAERLACAVLDRVRARRHRAMLVRENLHVQHNVDDLWLRPRRSGRRGDRRSARCG